MADTDARDISTLPLSELTPAELHARGLARLELSLQGTEAADGVTANQAAALFFASVSAAGQAGAGGSHRPGTAPDDRPLRDRAHPG